MRDDPTTIAVAAEIRAQLGRQNRTQAWLSEQTGIGAPSLSRRLKGHLPFSLDELDQIAAALDVPLRTLLPSDDPVGGAA